VSSNGANRLALFGLSEQVLSLLPAAVYVCDAEGAIQYFNRRAVELWGREPKLGDTDQQFCGALRLYYPDGRPMAHAQTPMAAALRCGERQQNREAIIERPDGSRITVMVNIDPLRDERGELIGAVNVFQDVSDRKQTEIALRVSESRFSRFMQHLPGLAWIKDLQGRYIYASEAAARAFNRPGEELYGKRDEDLFPAETAAQFRANDAAALGSSSGIQTVETLRHDDGVLHYSIVSKFPISGEDGRPAAIGGIAIDFTDRLAAEAALRESELRFRQLAENINEIFWISDPEKLEVLYISPAYEQIWGTSRESLYQRPRSFLDRVHPEDVQRVLTDSLQRQQRGEPSDVEYRIVRDDATVRWIRDRSFPVRDESGHLYRIVGIAEDITAQRRAAETARFLSDVSAALSGLVDYESTLQRIARMAVPYFADWCVVDLLDESGQLKRLSVAHSDPEKVKLADEFARRYSAASDPPSGARRVAQTGQPELVEEISDALIESLVADEERRRIIRELGLTSYICVPLVVRGRVFGTMSFVAAESRRRYTADDLAIAEDLAHRAAIAVENARLYSELKASDRRKDEFLAMLAHELRNPLAPIRAGLDLLVLDGHRHECIPIMKEQVNQLVRMVDDLLDVSRIMRGKIQLQREPVAVATIVQHSLAPLRTLYESLEHRLHVSLPPEPVYINADCVRMAQVVTNLLNNAAKYTDPGGDIRLSAAVEGGDVCLSVRDNGIGIEPELLPRVFDLFAQSSRSLERSQGGLGIGLTLVRTLVELHGGNVAAHSDGPGAGSEFVVRLPVCSHRQAEAKATDHVPVGGRRILVVDDNAAVADVQARLLSALGPHETQTAYDGPSALRLAASFRPEIVLLDLGLPHMDGFEVARRLRNSPEFADTLLVALTGYGTDEDRRRSREAGFDEHLVKPPSMDSIDALLRHPKLAGRS
jgi:PAS domain S-box-containing protein